MKEDGKILLGTAELTEANRFRSQMAKEGVTIEIMHNHQTCSTGCRTTVELWANPADVPTIQQVINTARQKLYAGLEFDPKVVTQVFDTSKDKAQCPACGTEFATTARECPDCGLVFDIPEEAGE